MEGRPVNGATVGARLGVKIDGGAPGVGSRGGGGAGVPSVDTAGIPDKVSLFTRSIYLWLYRSVAVLADCLLNWASCWRLLIRVCELYIWACVGSHHGTCVHWIYVINFQAIV